MNARAVLQSYFLYDLTADDLASLCLDASGAFRLIGGAGKSCAPKLSLSERQCLLNALPDELELTRLKDMSLSEVKTRAALKTKDGAVMLMWLYTLERRHSFHPKPFFLKDAPKESIMIARLLASELTTALNCGHKPIRSESIFTTLGQLCLDPALCPALQPLVNEHEEALLQALKALKMLDSQRQLSARMKLTPSALGFYAGFMLGAAGVGRPDFRDASGFIRARLAARSCLSSKRAAYFKTRCRRYCLEHNLADPFEEAAPPVVIPGKTSKPVRSLLLRLNRLIGCAEQLDLLKGDERESFLTRFEPDDAGLICALSCARSLPKPAVLSAPQKKGSVSADDLGHTGEVRGILLELREELRDLRGKGFLEEFQTVQEALHSRMLVTPDFSRLEHGEVRRRTFKGITALLHKLGIGEK